MTSSKTRRFRWVIAIVAMALLIWYVGPAKLASTVAAMDSRFVIAYAGAFLAVPFLYGLQLYGALQISGSRPPFGHAVGAAVNSWSVGTLTPARAGDLSLAFFLEGEVPASDANAMVIVDKAVSLVVLAGIALLSAPLMPEAVSRAVMLGSGLVFAVAIAGLTLLATPSVDTPLRATILRLLGATAEASWASLRRFVRNARLLLWSTLMAAMRWCYIGVINLLIFRAFDASPDLSTVLAASSVGRIISVVPVSIGGLGVKEPAQILIYGSGGVSADAVMAVSIVGLACGFVVAAVAPIVARPFARPVVPETLR